MSEKFALLSLLVLPAAVWARESSVPAAYGDVRLKGPVGERLDRMIERNVARTDTRYLTEPFQEKIEKGGKWQTEFWGKYMHAAVPLWTYSQNAALGANIDAGVEAILASQEPGGYIGNYPENVRFGGGWDVWGIKYTLMGLLHYYDLVKEEAKAKGKGEQRCERVLSAAKKLCDALIAALGPEGTKKRPVYKTGCYVGMASSSVLEPVVWLYRRTGEKRYLDFADFIVKGMTEAEDGPRLVDLVEKGISVADRNGYGNKPLVKGKYWTSESRSKAYEMMSCYQGLLDYVEEKVKAEGEGEQTRRLWKATLLTAEDILKEEINIVGGASCGERWYHGARKQSLQYVNVQETCVVTTWMRFCEKLLAMTDDPKWADELERSFYNAYLGALKADGSEFSCYTPMDGYRASGHHHCWMHTNCCNANGPRGFLCFLRALLMARENTAFLNFYASGRAETTLPASGRKVAFETYTLYPKMNRVRIANHTSGEAPFTLALRIPAWSSNTVVRVNNRAFVTNATAGAYCRLERTWKTGDVVEIDFDLTVRNVELEHHMAFLYGPIVLARAERLDDGPTDEVVTPGDIKPDKLPVFTPARCESDDTWMQFTASISLGSHHESPGERPWTEVKFCDYASAGNRWGRFDAYRVWLPVEFWDWE